ncbi:YihY/virulence factor BrkB family protein [Flavobacterium psychrophilum]|uniref:YihY/virulence factor BrkB family protein n=1 Tax=Flavobacterium psychrophilum TaxID=96345 RepID=UPI00090C5405|nr:YihY/virulence factor BrkB family protein [Flavobacterium psychrophilum]EKT2072619.1 YihY/virulence factor BrkB family protein [Flavobacterium psychrophilum]EKT4492132.1 YihY/virulence factor BrkB family protein [Flavobacterium psychrophilum]SHH93020.1 Probable ribonuclease BN [Flavobacterium psychrophilum]
MKHKIKDILSIFKTAFKEWWAKDPFRQSAIIAYYAIFGIPGLLVLIIAVAGYFFGTEIVNQNLMAQISETIGSETAMQIQEVLTKSTAEKSTIWGSIVGVSILLLGATGVFVELQKTLNLIWNVKVKPQNGIWLIIKARLFSFGLILAIAFLLTISLVISTALVAISNYISFESSQVMMTVYSIINFIISILVISALFAMIFKILPDAKIQWKHVWLGSIVTGILFTVGKMFLAYYFGKAQPASIYGAAGSIILILLWVSYSSMILFFGAEFTAAFAKKYSGIIAPTAIAKVEIPTATEKMM